MEILNTWLAEIETELAEKREEFVLAHDHSARAAVAERTAQAERA